LAGLRSAEQDIISLIGRDFVEAVQLGIKKIALYKHKFKVLIRFQL